MKVYKAVDKTFAYTDDLVTYTISYRNYGSVNATGVTITDALPAGYQFVSASNGGTLSGSTVTWNIGNVPGFTTAGGTAPTQGSVTLVVKVLPSATGRLCNTATITCSNGTGWTSNEYPNNVTDIMQRNCVDIVQRPLYINKNANMRYANPGQVVDYTLDFGNQSVPFLNGGRPGVNVAFANNGTPASSNTLSLKIRLYHGADEAYINYQNYRISYFLQDANTAWVLGNTIYEGGLLAGVTTTQQNLNPGTSGLGNWNQRIIIRFANQLCTTTPHILRYSGLLHRIHQGGSMMLRGVWDMHDASYANHNWADDWSGDNLASGADGSAYHPVTNDWTDPNNPNLPVTKLHKNACGTVSKTVSKILVEEWDGYTWRRAFGNGPVSGREVQNVIVQDVLPTGVTFGGFTQATTLGVTATYNAGTRTITWTIPLMRINDVGQLKYWVTVNSAASFGGCPINSDQINVANISGTNESPAYARDTVTVTCNPVPPPAPPPSDLVKTVTSGAGPYLVGSSITYQLTYTNNSGSIATPSLNNATDWNLRSGPGNFTFGSGTLTTVNNQNTVMTYGWSHGTNGSLTGTINAAANAIVGIAVRHTGGAVGNGVYVTFKPNPGAGTVAITFWNGTTAVGTGSYSLAAGPFTYRIVLNGGTISVWLNNFSGAPLASQTGMTVQAGYAGVINGDPLGADAWGSHAVSNFVTNLDSSFNIQFYDPVPSNVTYVSSSVGGSLVTGNVQWPVSNNTTTTPLLAGATITKTWTGTVNGCVGGFISNTGFVKVLGYSPDQGSQINVSCTTPTPIALLYFKASVAGKDALLDWASTSEEGSAYFEVERSRDGIHFTSIKQLPAQGMSQMLTSYHYNDQAAVDAAGVYYRLKMVDLDGHIAWSDVRRLSIPVSYHAELYPNPFDQSFHLKVSGDGQKASVKVYSVLGSAIESMDIPLNTEVLLGQNLADGVYLIEIQYDTFIERHRLVKSK